MARPTKLTPEIQAKIVQAIELGNYTETAVLLAGISKQTFYTWLKLGNAEEEGIHREFLDAVEKALATAEARDVQTIDEASKENWQAAAWKLERKHPQKWGRRLQINTDEIDRAIDDELARLAAGSEASDADAAEGQDDGRYGEAAQLAQDPGGPSGGSAGQPLDVPAAPATPQLDVVGGDPS